MRPAVISGIRHRFQCLSRSQGQITHVLLTRSPLIHPQQAESFSVRLACVTHAASVRPEPGPTSPYKTKHQTTPQHAHPSKRSTRSLKPSKNRTTHPTTDHPQPETGQTQPEASSKWHQ